jgi:predicted O-methyltransferase YrrM
MLIKVSSLPNPRLPWNPHGWFRWQDDFDRMLKDRKPRVCVDVGTWCGLSALFVAERIKEWNGILVAVDPWNGFVPVPGDPLCEEIAPRCFEQFVSNVYHRDLAGCIWLVRGTSLDVPDLVRPDWVYLDGSHEYADTIEDLELWLDRLRPGGILLGDDFGMAGVHKAWLEVGGEIHTNGDQLVWIEESPSES